MKNEPLTLHRSENLQLPRSNDDDVDDGGDDDDEDGDDNEDMCVQCQDYNAYCAAWAREGQCRKNQAYMDIYCAKVGRTSSDYVEINLGIQDFS